MTPFLDTNIIVIMHAKNKNISHIASVPRNTTLNMICGKVKFITPRCINIHACFSVCIRYVLVW